MMRQLLVLLAWSKYFLCLNFRRKYFCMEFTCYSLACIGFLFCDSFFLSIKYSTTASVFQPVIQVNTLFIAHISFHRLVQANSLFLLIPPLNPRSCLCLLPTQDKSIYSHTAPQTDPLFLFSSSFPSLRNINVEQSMCFYM